MILYRPVGMHELHLVFESKLRAFPPRLPGQPIFYPVVNQEYAEQIARDWNSKSDPFVGYVTQFTIVDNYISKYERHIVGDRRHEEFWIPAAQLDDFNKNITPPIRVVGTYFGDGFRGFIPDKFGLKGRGAVEQFVMLAHSLDYSPMDFGLEILANSAAIFLHYPFWMGRSFTERGISEEQHDRVLTAIQRVWSDRLPELPLPMYG
jgi:hypothetical protein